MLVAFKVAQPKNRYYQRNSMKLFWGNKFLIFVAFAICLAGSITAIFVVFLGLLEGELLWASTLFGAFWLWATVASGRELFGAGNRNREK